MMNLSQPGAGNDDCRHWTQVVWSFFLFPQGAKSIAHLPNQLCFSFFALIENCFSAPHMLLQISPARSQLTFLLLVSFGWWSLAASWMMLPTGVPHRCRIGEPFRGEWVEETVRNMPSQGNASRASNTLRQLSPRPSRCARNAHMTPPPPPRTLRPGASIHRRDRQLTHQRLPDVVFDHMPDRHAVRWLYAAGGAAGAYAAPRPSSLREAHFSQQPFRLMGSGECKIKLPRAN